MGSKGSDGEVRFGDRPTGVADWDGLPLSEGGPVALVVLPRSGQDLTGYPSPTLAAACGGGESVAIDPDRLGDFLRSHEACLLVCEHSGFLCGVLEGHLQGRGDREGLASLVRLADGGRLVDITLLDQLLDLAEDGVEHDARRADKLVKDRAGQQTFLVSEVDPADLTQAQGRLAAATLAAGLLAAHGGMAPKIEAVEERAGIDLEDDSRPLSLVIQVWGEIALDRAARLGLAVPRVNQVIELCRSAYSRYSLVLNQDRSSRECFEFHGDVVRLDGSGHPKQKQGKLLGWLGHCVESIPGAHELRFRPPWSRAGEMAKSSTAWGEFAEYHPEIDAWVGLWAAATAIRELKRVRGDRGPLLRPSYQSLPRIRSNSPDIERLRVICGRPIFQAPDGRVLLVGRLDNLELRFLAAWDPDRECAESLAACFRAGKDPIRQAAAALYALEDATAEPEFDALERDDPALSLAWTTIASIVMRLAPRGLFRGFIAEAIAGSSACSRVGLKPSAISRCYSIVVKRFQQIELAGLGRSSRLLADYLKIGPQLAWGQLAGIGDVEWSLIRKAVRGDARHSDMLDRLVSLTEDPDVKSRLAVGSPTLYSEIFEPPQRSGFGRVRSRLEHHQGGGQDLLDGVDDVRKAVYYRIVRAGHDLAAVAGDEFVVLARMTGQSVNRTLEDAARDIERVAEEEMTRFLGEGLTRCTVEPRGEW